MNIEEAAHHDSGDDFAKMDCGISDRLGFIRKVYGILSTQLLITSCFTLYAMSSTSMKTTLDNPAYSGIVIVTYIVSICALVCCKQDKKVPANYIWLLIFTLCVSWIVATVCVRTKPTVVVEAAFLTTSVVVAITIYAVTTKNDYTMCGPLMFILGFVFLTASILACCFGPQMNLLWSTLGVILFSFYLLIDTQMIVSTGHKKYQIGEDSYILAALALYLDIINIFLYIIEMLNN